MKENACCETNVLNGRQCMSRTLHRFQTKENMPRENYECKYEIICSRSH